MLFKKIRLRRFKRKLAKGLFLADFHPIKFHSYDTSADSLCSIVLPAKKKGTDKYVESLELNFELHNNGGYFFVSEQRPGAFNDDFSLVS